MGAFQNYPYSDVHQLNLDWILQVIKAVKAKADLIESAVTTAQESAEIATESAESASSSALSAQNFLNQVLYLTGSAVVANSASDMTDTSKVYIYVGSESGYETNHWYYYNGSQWVDGGLYGASSSVTDNAINILEYILNHLAYTDQGMQSYIDALLDALRGHELLTTFTITNVLSHITTSNDATGINYGESYHAVLTAEDDYEIGEVTVTMGEADITTTAYSNGVINIASVTGDLVINAQVRGALPSAYTEVAYITADQTGTTHVSNRWLATEYINTGLIPDGWSSIRQEAKLRYNTSLLISTTNDYARNGASGTFIWGSLPPSNGTVHYCGGNSTDTGISPNTVTFDEVSGTMNLSTGEFTFILNGTTINSGTAQIFSTTRNIVLLAFNDVANSVIHQPMFCDLAYYRIYNDNTLVADFVPCIRNSDTKAGMYDVVRQQFFPSSGSADFTYTPLP